MAIKVNTYNQKAEKIGDITLSNKIFGLKVNESLVHQAMVAQNSNERQVLAHTKDRSEVRGGGRKPWAQKGTGRARAGSSRSPIWIGGGVTFGPRSDRNFKKDLNKKMKRAALFMVFSNKVEHNNLVVVDSLAMEDYKTKAANEIISAFEVSVFAKSEAKKAKRSVLIISDSKSEKANGSFKNLEGVKVINLDNVNIVDMLRFKNVVISTDNVTAFEEKYK